MSLTQAALPSALGATSSNPSEPVIPATMSLCRPTRYGAPEDALKILHDVPVPQPKDLKKNQVLVKVMAASLNAGDYHVLRADPPVLRMMTGLFKPKTVVALGNDFSGVVVGMAEERRNGNGWRIGDRVFGDLFRDGLCGACAEFAIVDASKLIRVEDNVSFEDAACLPVAGCAALGALKHAKCGKKEGERVLINGASGGVGHYAVQIAKKVFGAEVTGVCSRRNVELVKTVLGADHVIDYTKCDQGNPGNYYDLEENKNKFDVIIDCANDQHATTDSCKKTLACLRSNGRYILVGGNMKGLLDTAMWGSWYARRAGEGRTAKNILATSTVDLCGELMGMASDGKIKPFVDEENEFELVRDGVNAMKVMDAGRTRGKILLKRNQVHDLKSDRVGEGAAKAW